MNTVELAQKVRVHPQTIRRMCERNEIDYDPIGGSRGFSFEEDAVEQARRVLKKRHLLRRKEYLLRRKQQTEK